jgi:hypothetical protein
MSRLQQAMKSYIDEGRVTLMSSADFYDENDPQNKYLSSLILSYYLHGMVDYIGFISSPYHFVSLRNESLLDVIGIKINNSFSEPREISIPTLRIYRKGDLVCYVPSSIVNNIFFSPKWSAEIVTPLFSLGNDSANHMGNIELSSFYYSIEESSQTTSECTTFQPNEMLLFNNYTSSKHVDIKKEFQNRGFEFLFSLPYSLSRDKASIPSWLKCHSLFEYRNDEHLLSLLQIEKY